MTNGVCISAADAGGGRPREDAGEEEPAPATDRCAVASKETGTVGTKIEGGTRAEITGAVTLGCEKDWVLDALVFVRAGATLTIEPGTTIRATKGSGAGLVVSTGARLVAEGQREAPIVFTSDAATPAAGDWRGVFLLGLAPPAEQEPFEGDPDLPWGGTKADDDSGVLSFVRIEYARNGLALAGAGNKTKVDSVQVRQTIDNCFMFLGGRVDAKHLVCQSTGDDQFEWYLGYEGRAQFLFGQKTPPPPVFNAGGILVDDANALIFNATFCGDTTKPNGYGVVVRDNGTLHLNGAVVSGWFAGVDVTGNVPEPGAIRSSIFFGNTTNPAYAEERFEMNPDFPNFDDDNGFNELNWFNASTRKNAVTDPKLVDCFDPKSPKPWPAVALTTNGPEPPNDGFFDTSATYIGAFKDGSDPWMKGSWLRFDDK